MLNESEGICFVTYINCYVTPLYCNPLRLKILLLPYVLLSRQKSQKPLGNKSKSTYILTSQPSRSYENTKTTTKYLAFRTSEAEDDAICFLPRELFFKPFC